MPGRKKRNANQPRFRGRFTSSVNHQHSINFNDSPTDHSHATGSASTSDTASSLLHSLDFALYTCDCCLRRSTSYCPLHFHTVATDNLMRRIFGENFTAGRVARLCNNCCNYKNRTMSNFSQSPHFADAWPSVFWDFLKCPSKGLLMWRIVPEQLKASWIHQRSSSFSSFFQSLHFVYRPVFEDISVDLTYFMSFKRTWTAKEMRHHLDLEFFPRVKCPVGCWCFIETPGRISFKHYLAYQFPAFMHFNCDSKNLNAKRYDYETNDEYFQLKIAASTVFQGSGELFLVTCEDHEKVSNQSFCHVARSPFNRLFSPIADQYAPAVMTMKSLTPFRPNFSTASYKMLPLTGSFQGTSTVAITTNRVFDGDTETHWRHENLYLQTRRDCRTVLSKLVDKNLVSEDFLNNVQERVTKSLQPIDTGTGGNYVSIEAIAFMKFVGNFNVETNTETSDDCWSRFLHRFLSTMCFTACQPLDDIRGRQPSLLVCNNNTSTLLLFLILNNVQFIYNILQPNPSNLQLQIAILKCFTKTNLKCANNNVTTDMLEVLAAITDDVPMQQLLSSLPKVVLIEVASRRDALPTLNPPIGTSFIVFATNDRLCRGNNQPPLEIKPDDIRFILVSVIQQTRMFLRYKQCPKWWMLALDTNDLHPVDTFTYDRSDYRFPWKILIYERYESTFMMKQLKTVIQNMNGQNVCFCNDHQTLLCSDFQRSGYICQFNSLCRNVSNWRCPFDDCSVAICRSHFEHLEEQTFISIIPDKHVPRNHMATCDNDEMEPMTDNDFHCFDQYEYDELNPLIDAPTDAGTDVDVGDNTDTGHVAVTAEFKSDLRSVGLCVLLNGMADVLNRANHPITFRKNQWRHLQKIVASYPDASASTLFPEAMLRPSVFPFVAEHSFVGAIPSALLASEKFNQHFQYASLHDHIKARLLNGSLLTSTDPFMLQYYFDCYMNMKLNSQDVRFIIHRGLPELYREGDMSSDRCRLKMDDYDSRRMVNELAAALRTEECTFLLTVTLNQAEVCGIKPFHDLVQSNISHMSEEEQRIVIEGNMVLIMRMWYRVSSLFVEYLTKSSELPLGHITRIFPRYEFQTSKGNAPHMHIVVWTEEKKDDPNLYRKISGSFARLLYELKVIFQSPTSVIESYDEFQDLISRAATLLSHDCAKASYRCHKKCDTEGNSICRFKIYEPAAETFFKIVDRPHSQEAWELLSQLSLAELRDGFVDVYRATNEMVAGKYNYDADFGETFSPVVASIFALLKCNMNCLLCDRVLSAAYIAKYAAGVEERAFVDIKAENATKVSVSVKGINNIKIAGAKLAASKDFSSTEQFRVISSTECVWTMLQLPYVMPSYECVHVSTLPMENRGGVIIPYKQQPVLLTIVHQPRYMFLSLKVVFCALFLITYCSRKIKGSLRSSITNLPLLSIKFPIMG